MHCLGLALATALPHLSTICSPAGGVAEIDAHLIFTKPREMPVPFDEYRAHVAVEVDDTRPTSRCAGNVLVRIQSR